MSLFLLIKTNVFKYFLHLLWEANESIFCNWGEKNSCLGFPKKQTLNLAALSVGFLLSVATPLWILFL